MSLTFQTHLLITLILVFSDCNRSEKANGKGFLDFIFSPCKCRCGVPNREARFYGGEYLRGYEFPWLALIHTDTGSEIDKIKSIPGTLINNKYIITGASPLIGLTPYSVKISLGNYNKCTPDVSSANISVEEIIVHPDFSVANHASDLALLKLSTPILLDRRISPICLSVPGYSYIGQVATIAGWPKDKDATEPSCRPKKLGLPVLGGKECLETTPPADFFTEDKGCIGLIGTSSVICHEDAGMPVMYRSHGGIYELIGILTSQNQCSPTHKSAGFYSRINKHLSWIINNTKDACYCVKT